MLENQNNKTRDINGKPESHNTIVCKSTYPNAFFRLSAAQLMYTLMISSSNPWISLQISDHLLQLMDCLTLVLCFSSQIDDLKKFQINKLWGFDAERPKISIQLYTFICTDIRTNGSSVLSTTGFLQGALSNIYFGFSCNVSTYNTYMEFTSIVLDAEQARQALIKTPNVHSIKCCCCNTFP